MNSCVMSLTNLNESQSLETYEKERENLINNLSKEGMAKLPEITDLREKILSTIYQLEITQEERQVLRKIKTLEKDGKSWRSVSNGLNQAMVYIPSSGRGGGAKKALVQTAFYTLLTAARSTVDYNAYKKEFDAEEARALWEIRKQDLKEYAVLNTEAYKKINEIFRYYKLDDVYELTPRQASEFNTLISDPDVNRRIQKLLNNANSLKYLNEFNYYLGMAYIQNNEYARAVPYFKTYISNSQKAKIYKIDDKLGCIYLSLLTYDEQLPKSVAVNYIQEALRNLPHNGAAYIECAAYFWMVLGEKEKAFDLLRTALYDDMLSDKEAIIMTITEWIPQIKETPYYESIYSTICSSINENIDYISLNSYLQFLIACSDERAWMAIERLITINNEGHNIKPEKSFKLQLAKNLDFTIDSILVFSESFSKDKLLVTEKGLAYTEGYTKEQLTKKFSLFTNAPDLIYLFFDYNKDGNVYYVKRSLSVEDFNKLKYTPDQFEGLKNFSFDFTDKSTPDRKALNKIIKFCKKNQSKTPSSPVLICSSQKNKNKIKEELPYLDNKYQDCESIKLVTQEPSDKYDTLRTYKIQVKKRVEGAYPSFIPVSYSSDHIRIILKGNNSNTIVLLYSIEGKQSELLAIQTGDKMVYRYPVNITQLLSKIDLKQDDDVTETNVEKKSLWQKIKSLFQKKDKKKKKENKDAIDKESGSSMTKIEFPKQDSGSINDEDTLTSEKEKKSFWKRATSIFRRKRKDK